MGNMPANMPAQQPCLLPNQELLFPQQSTQEHFLHPQEIELGGSPQAMYQHYDTSSHLPVHYPEASNPFVHYAEVPNHPVHYTDAPGNQQVHFSEASHPVHYPARFPVEAAYRHDYQGPKCNWINRYATTTKPL